MKRLGLGMLAALVLLAACSGPPAELEDPDLAAAGVLSHKSPAGSRYYPPGSGLQDRLRREGCACLRVAENLAEAGGWRQALSAWQASTDGHCEALFDVHPETGERLGLTAVGLGHVGRYWVLDMARPR